MRRRLDPGKGRDDVPVEFEGAKDEEEEGMPNWEDLMRWQLEKNEGFVSSYLSTFQHGPIFDQHDGDWKVLGKLLGERRRKETLQKGLTGGRICVVLGEKDIYVNKEEWIEDARRVLGEDAVDVYFLEGGHEIAIAEGREVARVAMKSWRENASTS